MPPQFWSFLLLIGQEVPGLVPDAQDAPQHVSHRFERRPSRSPPRIIPRRATILCVSILIPHS
jgi:hypothetical protein